MYNAKCDQERIKKHVETIRDPDAHTCLCGKPKHPGQAFCPECLEKYKTAGC